MACADRKIITLPFQFATGRQWMGTAFGGLKGRSELPGMVEDYLVGKIEIDGMITYSMAIEEINRTFYLMHEAKEIRSVETF